MDPNDKISATLGFPVDSVLGRRTSSSASLLETDLVFKSLRLKSQLTDSKRGKIQETGKAVIRASKSADTNGKSHESGYGQEISRARQYIAQLERGYPLALSSADIAVGALASPDVADSMKSSFRDPLSTLSGVSQAVNIGSPSYLRTSQFDGKKEQGYGQQGQENSAPLPPNPSNTPEGETSEPQNKTAKDSAGLYKEYSTILEYWSKNDRDDNAPEELRKFVGYLRSPGGQSDNLLQNQPPVIHSAVKHAVSPSQESEKSMTDLYETHDLLAHQHDHKPNKSVRFKITDRRKKPNKQVKKAHKTLIPPLQEVLFSSSSEISSCEVLKTRSTLENGNFGPHTPSVDETQDYSPALSEALIYRDLIYPSLSSDISLIPRSPKIPSHTNSSPVISNLSAAENVSSPLQQPLSSPQQQSDKSSPFSIEEWSDNIEQKLRTTGSFEVDLRKPDIHTHGHYYNEENGYVSSSDINTIGSSGDFHNDLGTSDISDNQRGTRNSVRHSTAKQRISAIFSKEAQIGLSANKIIAILKGTFRHLKTNPRSEDTESY